LKRKMKVRAYFGQNTQFSGKFICYDTGLQRPQPNPHNTVHFMYGADQIQQMSFSVKIYSVRTQMNSRQNNFPIAVFSKIFYFSYDVFLLSAAHPPPCKRNDTVCAELVTPVLYFNVSSRMIPRFRKMQAFILLSAVNIFHTD